MESIFCCVTIKNGVEKQTLDKKKLNRKKYYGQKDKAESIAMQTNIYWRRTTTKNGIEWNETENIEYSYVSIVTYILKRGCCCWCKRKKERDRESEGARIRDAALKANSNVESTTKHSKRSIHPYILIQSIHFVCLCSCAFSYRSLFTLLNTEQYTQSSFSVCESLQYTAHTKYMCILCYAIYSHYGGLDKMREHWQKELNAGKPCAERKNAG